MTVRKAANLSFSQVHRQSCVMQALTGNQVGHTTAAAALEELFSSGGGGGRAGTSKRVTVLLVDEMDLLVTKKQTVSTVKLTLLQSTFLSELNCCHQPHCSRLPMPGLYDDVVKCGIMWHTVDDLWCSQQWLALSIAHEPEKHY